MKNNLLLITLFVLSSYSLSAQEEDRTITIGKRYSIESEFLNETRFYNVYLPPSYQTSNHSKYPVVYLIDGDYNFHHTTGLIEQLSSISEKIPEMIVVGIADNGHNNYVNNCTSFDEKNNPSGQSEKFLNFITTELKPHINKNYKSAEYDILIGHSLGGLFTINALLSKPESFNAYISISPSLWWNEYEAENKVTPFYEKYDSINRFLFLSLANEKGMGVLRFINQLDINSFADEYYKNKLLGLSYTFKQFPDENHNSVGLITINQALKLLFKNYDLSNNTLNSLKTFKEYENIIEPYYQLIGKGFRLPNRNLNYLINLFFDENNEELITMENSIKEKYPASLGDYYNNVGNVYIKKGNLKKGIEIHQMNFILNPNSPEYLTSLADAYFANKEFDKAKINYQNALDLAINQNTREWYINQLKYNVEKNN
ncbi:MAG: hypothetical protein IH949_09670 [Bacteroidetes bacterium]|nr:hypothetical protein [Bacteroidota bacterium]